MASAAAAPRHHPCRCHRHWRHCHRCHRHSCHRCQDPVRHLCPEESLPRKSPLRQTCQGHFQGRWLGRVGAQPNHLWPTTTSTGRIALDIEESMVVIDPLFKPQPWAEPWPGQCRPCQLPFCSYCCTHTGIAVVVGDDNINDHHCRPHGWQITPDSLHLIGQPQILSTTTQLMQAGWFEFCVSSFFILYS